eukprot:TRINITY_DN3031_c0_g2_i1.p1 TRINITY_DN3031_c0_g2~~TRINITY_DN3031_c0_g2_i1.p1  ORF type:complete len:112 (+),score=40.35 TRINITY_DN3031_c0_g2_i1:93-428(+)
MTLKELTNIFSSYQKNFLKSEIIENGNEIFKYAKIYCETKNQRDQILNKGIEMPGFEYEVSDDEEKSKILLNRMIKETKKEKGKEKEESIDIKSSNFFLKLPKMIIFVIFV